MVNLGFSHDALPVHSTVDRWFPLPRLVMPRSIGIDISDTSLKWIGLRESRTRGFEVATFGTQEIPAGVIRNGVVHDAVGLADALRALRAQVPGFSCAHAALPEEAAYVFPMRVPQGTSYEQALKLIEFEFDGRVPIAPSETVYDFERLGERGAEGEEIAVAVFPRDIAESYAAVFAEAGLSLASLEMEARSIARAVSSGEEGAELLVDFGRARTGFAILERGIPVFTSTATIGGDAITKALMEKLSLTPEDVEVFKDEVGLLSTSPKEKEALAAISAVAEGLADEIGRHFHFWDTRRDQRGGRSAPINRVLLVGGSSNLKGLTDFIATRVHLKTDRPDVWRHVCSFTDYVPPIERRNSLEYATAVGLALRGV